MKTSTLTYKLYPKLIVTPQLRLALHILQLTNSQLKEFIKKKVSENPLLQPTDKESLNTKIKLALNSTDIYSQSEKAYYEDTALKEIKPYKRQQSETLNLPEYILHQLKMSFLNEEEYKIAEEIINHIDTNGYLRLSLDALAKNLNISLDKIENVLKIVQSFEPPGVGARNLQECLLIQLKHIDKQDSLAYKIIQSYFKELSRKKYAVISNKLHIGMDEIKEAIKEVISLNPKPGAAFSRNESISITPDVIVKLRKNKLQIILNEKNLPKLKINRRYKKLLQAKDTSEEIKQFIKERLKSALWLIRAIEQRQKNSLKVFRAILDIQKQAICKGLSYVKPLSLKDITKKTGLHLSTVGRIISHKYIATPRGTIKAKDLFSSKLTLEKSGEISSRSVLTKIENIILAEDKQKSLTDQTISAILGDEGIKVSRRTVAKYRNKLRIPPSFLR